MGFIKLISQSCVFCLKTQLHFLIPSLVSHPQTILHFIFISHNRIEFQKTVEKIYTGIMQCVHKILSGPINLKKMYILVYTANAWLYLRCVNGSSLFLQSTIAAKRLLCLIKHYSGSCDHNPSEEGGASSLKSSFRFSQCAIIKGCWDAYIFTFSVYCA